MGKSRGSNTPGLRALAAAVGLGVVLWPGPAAMALDGDARQAAIGEVARVRKGLSLDAEGWENTVALRTSYGRPAAEVEGWRRVEGGRWPIDQATFDIRSGRISKYVNFDNASRRRAGEAILPMGSVSARADWYVALFYPGSELSLEGIERFRVRGEESVYYELTYSPLPLEVPFLQPLVRLLVDASTGRLYRFELAADHLGAGSRPPLHISGSAAGKIAAIFLQQADLTDEFGEGASVETVQVADLYYVRSNGWLGAVIPEGGTARAAWLVQFSISGDPPGEPPYLLFVDALTGRITGGVGRREKP